MDCPSCGKSSFDHERTNNNKVLETRSDGKGGVRRRRVCPACGFRFTTYEIHQYDFVEELDIRKNYRKQLTETVEKSRQSILFALDKILLEL